MSDLGLYYFTADRRNDAMRGEISPVGELPLSTSTLRGKEGGCTKADIVLELSKGGCVNLRTRREGGLKNQKILRTCLMEAL